MNIVEKNQFAASPARGALNGLLLAKNHDNGITPSRPSSCMTRNGRLRKDINTRELPTAPSTELGGEQIS